MVIRRFLVSVIQKTLASINGNFLIVVSVISGSSVVIYVLIKSDQNGLSRVKQAVGSGILSTMLVFVPLETLSQNNGIPPSINHLVKSSRHETTQIRIRGGDGHLPGQPGKFGPGSKARGAAKANHVGKTPSIFVESFTTKPSVCYHNHNLSGKNLAKTKSLFVQGETNNDNNDNNDHSKPFSSYHGGPSPYRDAFDYEANAKKNIDFSNSKNLNHSFDKHAKDCFNISKNRNKSSLEDFTIAIQDYIESPQTVRINGSFRYERPAYHYKDPDQNLVVSVDARTNEYISSRNATKEQLADLEYDGNIGLDSRPLMVLRLRSPKE